MEALYWKRPTAASAAELGLFPSDYQEPQVTVAEENWAAIRLFCRFSTQWRTGPGGPVGLDYGVIHHELSRMGVTGDEHTDVMERLRVIEHAALHQIHKD